MTKKKLGVLPVVLLKVSSALDSARTPRTRIVLRLTES